MKRKMRTQKLHCFEETTSVDTMVSTKSHVYCKIGCMYGWQKKIQFSFIVNDKFDILRDDKIDTC